ncbi:domain of unknown function DUF1745 [Magnetococcus marinus MC-1]|uniref:FIST domain containing protein n=1 Tax=Magnetococcus marinus (strain ATCC BAA-1437 / JCM 17883 / MC-1) TaxID=156889 RepID=A0LAI6_MAGMM|nr:FIST N-terminal domain-containing protein [Magnetococcus marinus]ABK44979.1 domain of unknown function DUF1745 [Magnetococcus marinus MC-1]
MPKKRALQVKRGSSQARDPAQAVNELVEQIQQDGAVLTLLFVSPSYDKAALQTALEGVFGGVVVGCTTAGEITQAGFVEQSLTGVSLAGNALQAWAHVIQDLHHFNPAQAQQLGDLLHDALPNEAELDPDHAFALLLVDGLSMREEQLLALLHPHLDGIALVGGSAGDGLAFQESFVYAQGRWHHHAAVLTLVHCETPFMPFQWHHFKPTATRLIITACDPMGRRVTEINGLPASQAYATAVGVPEAALNSDIFSRHPTMLQMGGSHYVRAIQQANGDGSLTFYSAVERGLVLHLAQAADMVKHLEQQLHLMHAEMANPQLVLICDCILRRLEAKQKGVLPQLSQLLAHHPVIGFSTYGEQSGGIHINQTMTGIVLGGA